MIVVLCGGFGAARFVDGLRELDEDLCCVVNTADDLEYLGLHVAPDVDSVVYALVGRFDEERGWGLRGDTFRCNEALARYGEDWFHVGDEDMATHLERTALLARGLPLSAVTARLAELWGVRARVVPMSDDRVRTSVVTDAGHLSFQDYVVARRARPTVQRVDYEGIEDARPAPGVLDAIRDAEVVVVAPSNPVASIGPILALPGVREAVASRRAPTVAVTPVVCRRPPATPPEQSRARVREAFMAALGQPHVPEAVADLYRGLVDGFVLDRHDEAAAAAIEKLGQAVLIADTLAAPGPARVGLARRVVEFARGLR